MSVSLTAAARDWLRQAAVTVTTPAGGPVTMSEVLTATLAVAAAHPDELADHLRADKPRMGGPDRTT